MKETNPTSAPRLGRLLYGDCRSILPELPDGCVDFVLTDPPYLVGYRDRQGRTVQGDIDDSWLLPAFAEIHRTMKQNSFCLSFYGWTRADKFIETWRLAGFRLVGHIVFVKSYTSGTGFVHRRHEQAMLLAKGNPAAPRQPLPDVLPWGRYTGNKLHPTQKPVDLLRQLIRTFSKPGDLVLDPFSGSGSTAMAAKLEGRRMIGIEKDLKIHHVAKERLGY